MEKSLYSKIKIEDAEKICKRIIEDATTQGNSMIAAAKKEESNILEEAKKESESKKREIIKKSAIEIEKIRQKVFSTLNLEKKKLFLEEKSRFIETVLEKVKAIAMEFRKDQAYKQFLEKAILEGIDVVAEKDVEVLYSGLDEKIIEEIKIGNIQFKKSDFKDIGVIIQSKD